LSADVDGLEAHPTRKNRILEKLEVQNKQSFLKKTSDPSGMIKNGLVALINKTKTTSDELLKVELNTY